MRTPKTIPNRFPTPRGDIEYVVRAHRDLAGWTIVVDPVELDIDTDGTTRRVSIVDTLAETTTIPGHDWNPAAADTALALLGFDRAEPWDLRTTTNTTAWTQAVVADIRPLTLRVAS